jgi:GNAT superfamily N-acetyltransferase
MSFPYRVAPLSKEHETAAFASGDPGQDLYLQKAALSEVRRRRLACFVAIGAESGGIAGFYTLAPVGIPLDLLPTKTVGALHRAPIIPVVRLGRFAIALDQRGQGLRSALFADAILRVLGSQLVVQALVAEASDAKAADFYRDRGLIPFKEKPFTFFLARGSFIGLSEGHTGSCKELMTNK